MSGATFVRFYPSDWRSGCIGLSLEQEGLYVRICAFIFETGRRVPLDDSAAAKMLGVHTNAYRKARDQLAALGKISRASDGWSNARAEIELKAATGSTAKGEVVGQASENAGRNTRQDTLGDSPLDTPPDTRGVFSKKANVFFVREKSQEPIKEESVNQSFVEVKAAFNGSTEAMLAEVERAMRPYGDRAGAEQWLATTLRTYGQTAVSEAFQRLATARAEGKPISRVLPYWSKTAETIKATAPAKTANPARDDALRQIAAITGKRLEVSA